MNYFILFCMFYNSLSRKGEGKVVYEKLMGQRGECSLHGKTGGGCFMFFHYSKQDSLLLGLEIYKMRR